MIAVKGSVPASPTIQTFGTGLAVPYGLAVDASGNVYVADYGNNAVKEILSVGGVVPPTPTIKTLGSGFPLLGRGRGQCVGDVYVADDHDDAVEEMLAVSSSIPASPPSTLLAKEFPSRWRLRSGGSRDSERCTFPARKKRYCRHEWHCSSGHLSLFSSGGSSRQSLPLRRRCRRTAAARVGKAPAHVGILYASKAVRRGAPGDLIVVGRSLSARPRAGHRDLGTVFAVTREAASMLVSGVTVFPTPRRRTRGLLLSHGGLYKHVEHTTLLARAVGCVRPHAACL